jgi:hypothetical protein
MGEEVAITGDATLDRASSTETGTFLKEKAPLAEVPVAPVLIKN